MLQNGQEHVYRPSSGVCLAALMSLEHVRILVSSVASRSMNRGEVSGPYIHELTKTSHVYPWYVSEFGRGWPGYAKQFTFWRRNDMGLMFRSFRSALSRTNRYAIRPITGAK